MDRRFRAIGEYHRHVHLYLAGCLTWRKLENTGYRPNLSTILRARIVGRPTAYHERFMGIILAVPIGRSARKLVYRSRQCPAKTNMFAKFYYDRANTKYR